MNINFKNKITELKITAIGKNLVVWTDIYITSLYLLSVFSGNFIIKVTEMNKFKFLPLFDVPYTHIDAEHHEL